MSKWLKRLTLSLAVLCVLLIAAYVFRAPLLRAAARVWIVSDPPIHADVIVVLGGGPSTRPFAAARLFHQGFAPKILLTNPGPPPARPDLIPSEADLERSELLAEKVPASCIVIAPEWVTSTREEAVAVRDWTRTNAVKRILIPTDIFQTRRARWIFHKELKPLGIQVEVKAIPVREYTVDGWWTNDLGIVAFQNEILKYGYYRLKY